MALGPTTARALVGWQAADRWYRPAMAACTVVIATMGLTLLTVMVQGRMGGAIGRDLWHYLDGARRWLETGSPYLPAELAGSFQYGSHTFLHPPSTLLLFAPFLVLPAVLWWATPIAVVAWSLRSWRPAPWTWPLLAAPLLYVPFLVAVIVGNTDLWVAAGVAAGLRFGWPALVLVKPSLAPFLLVGTWHRSWWLGLVVVLLAAIPFGSLWSDWLAVVDHSPGDWTYSLHSVPWLAILLVAWWSGRSARSVQGQVPAPRH